jgi:CpeT protein
MRMRLLACVFGLTSLVLASCGGAKKAMQATPVEAQLAKLMEGSYLSSAQAQRDTDYFNISLRMYPIWQSRKGAWLYVEQAMAAKQDKPYRQRIYQLVEQADGTIASKVYTLKNEKDAIGKWSDAKWFDQFETAQVLEERIGCAVLLKRLDKTTYEGSTKEKDCGSTLRGATYATSIVRVEKNKIVSWDQGFDAADAQVWGATKGGYIFEKQ